MSVESRQLLPLLRRLAEIDLVRAQLPLILLGCSLSYFLAASLGIATSLPPEGIVILWPANAIVLVVLLAVGREHWWLVFLVVVGTEIAADVPHYPLWAAAGYGIVNFSEAAVAALVLSYFGKRPPLLAGLRDFIVFLAVGPLLAAGLAGMFGAAIYKFGAPEVDYLHYFRVFWLGDALGLLIVGTTLLVWRRSPSFGRLSPPRAVEAALLLAGLLTVASWVFLTDPATPMVYLIFPFLVWAALRFGVHGGSLAIVVAVTIAIGSAVSGFGPFTALSEIDTILSLQGLVAVVALSTFMLAFSAEDLKRTGAQLQHTLEEHRATESKLRGAYGELERINRDLDQIVAERTRELRRTLDRNEMLLQEVHHRVKNNLQLVASLLGLNSRGVSAPSLRAKFAEVQGQIAAIAATYDVLQQMQTVEVVDFCRIVPALCQNIDGATGDKVSIEIEASGDAYVPADSAVALALALNELITNSIKHAAVEGAAHVRVSCRPQAGNVLVTIADDGPGFPPDFDFGRSKSFGIRMAQDMVKRAGGHLRIVPSDGAMVEISVPCVAKPD